MSRRVDWWSFRGTGHCHSERDNGALGRRIGDERTRPWTRRTDTGHARSAGQVITLSRDVRYTVVAIALQAAADDYIVKPFSPTELVAEIQPALRRRVSPQWMEPPEPFTLEDLCIDFANRQVRVAG